MPASGSAVSRRTIPASPIPDIRTHQCYRRQLVAGNYNVGTDGYGCDTTLVTTITAPAAIAIANLVGG